MEYDLCHPQNVPTDITLICFSIFIHGGGCEKSSRTIFQPNPHNIVIVLYSKTTQRINRFKPLDNQMPFWKSAYDKLQNHRWVYLYPKISLEIM